MYHIFKYTTKYIIMLSEKYLCLIFFKLLLKKIILDPGKKYLRNKSLTFILLLESCYCYSLCLFSSVVLYGPIVSL